MKRFWWQVILTIPAKATHLSHHTEILSQELIDLGSESIQEVSKKASLSLIAFFPSIHKKENLKKQIMMSIEKNPIISSFLNHYKIKIKKFSDTSWAHEWKKYAKPILINKRIGLLPSHVKKIPKHFPKNSIILRIDPQLAFGTGSHPTTFLCLKALLEVTKNKTVSSFLDLGCGSGILAICAFFLGIREIVGIDCDPIAIEIARENAINHHCEKKINLKIGTIYNESKRFDLIIANILLKTIVADLNAIKKHLNKNGVLILSGILSSQRKDILKELKKEKISIIEEKNFRGWLCLSVKKK